MRLYLSSFRLGNRPDALLDLLNGGRRAAGIKTDDERAASYERERSDLAELGLDPYELDLRDYFDRPDALLTPNLHGAELVDDPANVPPGYPPEIVWDCLGLLPFHIAPHYRSGDHSESEAIDHVVSYLIDNHLPFIALRDGEALVFDGERKDIVGGRD